MARQKWLVLTTQCTQHTSDFYLHTEICDIVYFYIYFPMSGKAENHMKGLRVVLGVEWEHVPKVNIKIVYLLKKLA